MTSVSGILPVDKPSGPTSHDVVARARKSLGLRRVGHTGTLDPFASGLLILVVGPSTRLAEYLSDREKVYLGTVRLGVATATHDVHGDEVGRSEGWKDLSRKEVEVALGMLEGEILQRPPVFSAKKVAGEAAHRRVRRGETVDLPPVKVTVHEIEITRFSPPDVDIRVRCSSGTYIRALARDLGEQLRTGAHLRSLRRVSVGAFSVDEALTARQLDHPETARAAILPPARALAGYPSVNVDAEQARRLAQGRVLELPGDPGVAEERPVAVLVGERLVAVGIVEGSRLRPKKVLGGG